MSDAFDLRNRICSLAALTAAVMDLAIGLPFSPEIERLQCLVQIANHQAADALACADQMENSEDTIVLDA